MLLYIDKGDITKVLDLVCTANIGIQHTFLSNPPNTIPRTDKTNSKSIYTLTKDSYVPRVFRRTILRAMLMALIHEFDFSVFCNCPTSSSSAREVKDGETFG